MSGPGTLSVLVIAQDEQARIADAVRSVLAVADEVVVVDGGSRDTTVAICRDLGCRVVENPWPGYAAQRRHAVEQATGEWVFFLDADEVVTDELAASIRATVAAGPAENAFGLDRLGDFFGSWVGTDEQVRLCRRASAHIPDVLVHERIDLPQDQVGRLQGQLLHYGFRSISDHVARFGRYTDLEAESALAVGRRFSPLRLLLRPPAHFLLEYLGRGLWRKGAAGLSVALFWSVYDILTETKIYELQWRRRGAGAAPDHAPPP